MTKSESGSANRRCLSSAACWASAGRSRGSWMDSAAAMIRTSRTQPFRSASRIIRPIRGSTGSRASLRPSPVMRPSLNAFNSASRVSPSAMLRASGGSMNGNFGMSPRPIAAICRMTEARLVRRISGSVNSGRQLEVLFGVQPDADAVRGAAAAALALVGRRLRDRLDRQPLHLGPAAVPGDARGARVDDVLDAGHGERGLGHVGGQHHPAGEAGRGAALEDPVLLGGGQPPVQREDVEPVATGQQVRGVPDLPLAGQEHQDVAGSLGGRARRSRR